MPFRSDDFAGTILIVDDDAEDRLLLTRAITAELPHARILAAENGETALQLLEEAETAFDLIFIDLRMPRMNGIEFLETLARRGLAGTAALVVWSGVEDERLKWAAFGLNATLFVEKERALQELALILQEIDILREGFAPAVPDVARRA